MLHTQSRLCFQEKQKLTTSIRHHNFYTGFLVSLLHPELLLLLFFFIGNELRVRAKDSVPPREGRCVIANKVHVMEIMETGSSVERHQMKRVQWNIVATGGEGEKKIINYIWEET